MIKLVINEMGPYPQQFLSLHLIICQLLLISVLFLYLIRVEIMYS